MPIEPDIEGVMHRYGPSICRDLDRAVTALDGTPAAAELEIAALATSGQLRVGVRSNDTTIAATIFEHRPALAAAIL